MQSLTFAKIKSILQTGRVISRKVCGSGRDMSCCHWRRGHSVCQAVRELSVWESTAPRDCGTLACPGTSGTSLEGDAGRTRPR